MKIFFTLRQKPLLLAGNVENIFVLAVIKLHFRHQTPKATQFQLLAILHHVGYICRVPLKYSAKWH